MVAVSHEVSGAFGKTEQIIVAEERDEVTLTLGPDITLEESTERGGGGAGR